jgi:hypothetical protein
MWKTKLALALLLATGCKNASVDEPAKKDDESTTPAAGDPGKGRSAKIDLGARRTRPALGDTPTPAPGTEQVREQFEDRRKARIAQFDTDGDGKISADERAQARHKRAEDMRKQADTNNDGKVTADEIAASNFKRLDPASLDTDKNGDISADEIAAALEARNKAWGGGRFRPDARFGEKLKARGGSGEAPVKP